MLPSYSNVFTPIVIKPLNINSNNESAMEIPTNLMRTVENMLLFLLEIEKFFMKPFLNGLNYISLVILLNLTATVFTSK